MMQPRIVDVQTPEGIRGLQKLLTRPAFDRRAEATAAQVLADIRREGDRAVVRYARQFDKTELKPGQFRVRPDEIEAARRGVAPELRRAVVEADRRVAAFARRGVRRDWTMRTRAGSQLGERFMALDRVGVYVPGGKAPLVSTVIMTVTLARVAGVPEIVACTPCGRDGTVHPAVLFALDHCGAHEIYRVGGVQAIGMMAYGTRTVRKVRKIVGPGGPFVTAAKRQVYGDVALDLVAGPSEVAVLADADADPACIAADLLSQAEHGTGLEKALFVTPSMKLARAVQQEVAAQAERLSRKEALRKVIRQGMLLAVVRDLDEGVELCNRFAPEHLELLVAEPRKWIRRITAAGAIFVGKWSPECAGDFVAGPSHVLPTGGSAAYFSGLTVDDFRRRSSLIALSRRELKEVLPHIESLGRAEGLDGHARSGSIRFDRD